MIIFMNVLIYVRHDHNLYDYLYLMWERLMLMCPDINEDYVVSCIILDQCHLYKCTIKCRRQNKQTKKIEANENTNNLNA